VLVAGCGGGYDIVWFFDLTALAHQKPYLAEALGSETVLEVNQAIERFRESLGILPRQDIPI